jgi:predicted aconitase with swiveling domain
MREIVLRGRCASGGRAQGEALVSTDMIAFGGTPVLRTGVVGEPNHCLNGKSIGGKILVYPTGKGSTSDPYSCFFLMKHGNAPKAIINRTANPTTVVGAILSGIPMVYGFDSDPLAVIESGDWVEVDADEGVVKVRKSKRFMQEGGGPDGQGL